MFHQSAVIADILLLGFGMLTIVNQGNISTLGQKAKVTEEPWKRCDLSWDEMPAYEYFINDSEKKYNLTLKSYAADVVYEYAHDTGMENENWELKQMYHYRDEIYQVYTKSDRGSEIYLLLTCNPADARPCYIVAADIRKTENEDVVLSHGKGSYNSMLEWYSYEKAFNGEREMKEKIEVDVSGDLYDSYLSNHSYYAIFDYLERFGGDKKIPWEIDENVSYTGDGGIVISVSCIAGTEKINMFIDTYNKTYAVFK